MTPMKTRTNTAIIRSVRQVIIQFPPSVPRDQVAAVFVELQPFRHLAEDPGYLVVGSGIRERGIGGVDPECECRWATADCTNNMIGWLATYGLRNLPDAAK
jgi:hypothetical protein